MLVRLLAVVFALGLVACTNAPAAVDPSPGVEEAQPPASEVAASGAVHVVLREDARRQSYEVGGRSARDVRTALNRLGPYSSADGRRFDALTSWSLRWSFRYEQTGGGCALAGATVDYEVVMLLPDLIDAGGLPEALLADWDSYRAALEEHELGHVERQRQGAIVLQQTFAAFDGVWPSCRDLGRELSAAGEAQIAAIHAEDRRYDLDTEHGRLQGAVFP